MNRQNDGATILLVDDDDEVRPLLRRGLERAGFRVLPAADEREAAERGRHVRPDLILLELGLLPPRDVLAAGRRILASAGVGGGVPVVVYADHEDGEVREGEEVEVAPGEWVLLPGDSEQMVRLLRRLAS